MASRKVRDDGEAQKRNTDCVYFLASPLTCKKGADCEYRHSESARINPRDCRYWLNGNCINPLCPFRHPPLDGRPATASPPRVSSVAPGPPTKRTACFFFTQGFCARGDKCFYMHGLQTAPVSAAASQKLLKPVTIKSSDLTEKEASVSKGNGYKPMPEGIQEMQNSIEIKPPTQNDAQVADFNPIQSAHRIVSGQNNVVKSSAGEDSANSELARHNNQKLPTEEYNQFSTVEEMRFHVPVGQERVRQVISVEGRIKPFPSQIQTLDDRLQYVHSGEGRMQNGIELEDWVEESSPGFDVLVDAGPDQLIYRDDTDYLHRHDVLMEPHNRGRLIHSDDMGEFGYDRSAVCNQSAYYDTPGQYDLDSDDIYDQKQGCDHLYNHRTREQPILYNEDAIPAGDSSRTVPEEGFRHNGNDDLRNWITKRRRLDDRIQRRFTDNQCNCLRRDLSASDYQHGHRYEDGHSGRRDFCMQHHLLMQDEAERYYQSSHTRQEFGGKKHSYEHGNISEYAGSPEKNSFKGSPNKHNLRDHLRAKARGRDRECLVSEVSTGSSEIKGYVAGSYRRNEIRKDEMNFAGPKSLAQIKAEKRRASCQESIKEKGTLNEGSRNLVPVLPGNARQPVPLKSKISLMPGSSVDEDSVSREIKVNGGKAVPAPESLTGLEFEGPKPLHAILGAKGKSDPGKKPEDGGNEQISKDRFNPDMGTNSSFYANSGSSCQKGLESMELDQSYSTSCVQHVNVTELHHSMTKVQYPFHNIEDTPSQKVSPEKAAEVQGNRSSDTRAKAGSGIDMDVGTEHGGSAMEGEYLGLDGDDDDDDGDDFAKKLGGFFS